MIFWLIMTERNVFEVNALIKINLNIEVLFYSNKKYNKKIELLNYEN